MSNELRIEGPTRWEKVRTGIEAVFVSAPAGIAVGAFIGVLLFWLIEPDCTPNEWFCGLGELLVAMLVGVAVCVGVYGTIALRMIRNSLPTGHRSITIATVVVALPAIFVGLPLVASLFGI